MILVKGTRVIFDLEDGRSVKPPSTYGLLHDRSGRAWPKCSVLVAPFRKSRREVPGDSDARHYFGRQARLYEGAVALPPRPIGEWREVGRVTKGRIYYWRGGTKRPGPFQHPYNAGLHSMVFGKKRVVLYRRGRLLRLEMPDGCTIDDRGFVIP